MRRMRDEVETCPVRRRGRDRFRPSQARTTSRRWRYTIVPASESSSGFHAALKSEDAGGLWVRESLLGDVQAVEGSGRWHPARWITWVR